MVFNGSHDTRIHSSTDYQTITLQDVFHRAGHPSAVPKTEAPAFIPSSYCKSDGRIHQVQRELGRFGSINGDIDVGNHAIEDIGGLAVEFFGCVATLIYSSSSATPENRKWRIVVPLGIDLEFVTWREFSEAFYSFMESNSIQMDWSLARAGQPVFLPNVPPNKRSNDGTPIFYQYRITDGPPASSDSPVVAEWIQKLRDKQAADDLAKTQARDAARAAMEKRKNIGGGSVIEAFNRAHTIVEMLQANGYKRSPSNDADWQSPYQASDSYATRVFEGYWVSLSHSDAQAQLGAESASGHRCGDAFDIYRNFDHGGDFKAAVKAAAAMGFGSIPIEVTNPVARLQTNQTAVALPKFPEPFPGPMQAAVELALLNAFKPQPALTTLAVLIGMAAACHGSYKLPSGGRLNLYGTGVAPTGEGKDQPRHVAIAIADAAGAKIMGRAASGQGLEDALISNAGMLSEVDEIAHMLAAVNGSGAPNYLIELSSNLLRLYSASRGTYNARLRANVKDVATVRNPCLSVIGFATPSTLGASLKLSNVTDGLLGRLLFAFGESGVIPRRVSENFVLPVGTSNAAQAIISARLGKILPPGVPTNAIAIEPEAECRLNELMQQFDRKKRGSDSEFEQALLTRSFEKVERIAGVLAVWDEPYTTKIALPHVEWAARLVAASDAALLQFTRDYLHAGKVQAEAAAVLKLVHRILGGDIKPDKANESEALQQGYAPRSLVLKKSKLAKQEFDTAIAHLVALGDLQECAIMRTAAGGGQQSRPTAAFNIP